MVYEHLSRLYHRDEVRWKEEYERRSSSPMTRRRLFDDFYGILLASMVSQ